MCEKLAKVPIDRTYHQRLAFLTNTSMNHTTWIHLVVCLSDSSNILTRIGLGDVNIPVNSDPNNQVEAVEHSKLGVTK